MTFPNIQYKATNVYIESKWKESLGQKTKSLTKHLGTQQDVSCNVEFEKLAAHMSGEIHRVEMNLYVHGKTFRAEAIGSSFENAVDMVHKEVERELAKAHQKHDTLIKRGRRKIKEMLRFGR